MSKNLIAGAAARLLQDSTRANVEITEGLTASLQDQVGVVTGAARGIGRSIAMATASAGANLVVNDVLVEELAAGAKSLRAGTREILQAPGNISDDQFAGSLPARAIDEFGRLDFVVSNAAAFRPAHFLDMTLDDFDTVLAVNLRATFVLNQAAARLWVDRGEQGAILNISSVSASFAQPRLSHYGASKAAIERMSRNIALEVAPHGIRVNCIAPGGPILSEYVQNVMNRPDYSEYATLRPPLGRLGDPQEIAHAAVFLLSERASYITGTILTVDGGLTLGRSYSTDSAKTREEG